MSRFEITDMGEIFDDNAVVGLVNAWENKISLEATMSSNFGLEISFRNCLGPVKWRPSRDSTARGESA